MRLLRFKYYPHVSSVVSWESYADASLELHIGIDTEILQDEVEST